MKALSQIVALALLLSGCTPAVYLNLYNATDETLTVTKAPFRPTIIIAPHAAADIPLA